MGAFWVSTETVEWLREAIKYVDDLRDTLVEVEQNARWLRSKVVYFSGSPNSRQRSHVERQCSDDLETALDQCALECLCAHDLVYKLNAMLLSALNDHEERLHSDSFSRSLAGASPKLGVRYSDDDGVLWQVFDQLQCVSDSCEAVVDVFDSFMSALSDADEFKQYYDTRGQEDVQAVLESLGDGDRRLILSLIDDAGSALSDQLDYR